MPQAMLTSCPEQSTQRNATNERNARHQDTHKSSSVPDRRTPVDNRKSSGQAVRHVGIPESVWGRLASVAETRGVTVEDLLVASITEVIKPRSRQERIVQLAHAGLPDRVIAERTGELKGFVGEVRRRAGIPVNKQRRSDYEGVGE